MIHETIQGTKHNLIVLLVQFRHLFVVENFFSCSFNKIKFVPKIVGYESC